MSKLDWIEGLEWRKPVKQSRGERKIEAILDAAEHLVAERGTDNTAIADIAKLAESSVGAVYHHFPNKQAVFRALMQRSLQVLRDTSVDALSPERLANASCMDILQGYLVFSFRIAREQPDFKKAIREIALADPETAEPLATLEAELIQTMRELIFKRIDEVKHPQPERALAFAIDQCTTLVRARKEEWNHNYLMSKTDDDLIVEEQVRSMRLYLGIQADAKS